MFAVLKRVMHMTLFMCMRQISCEHGVLKGGSFSLSTKSWEVAKLERSLAISEEGSQFMQK